MAATRHALIIGGTGQLGEVVVAAFTAAGYSTVSVDFRAGKGTHNVVLTFASTAEERAAAVSAQLASIGARMDAIVCVAGGWAGGGAADVAVFASSQRMWDMNVSSALLTAHLAANHLAAGGLLVFTGAQAGLGPTPGMIGYGVAKAATIQLVASMAAPGSGLADGARVCAIMPQTLDTPQNRAAMPDADFSKWTPLASVADLLVGWAGDAAARPAQGALVNV